MKGRESDLLEALRRAETRLKIGVLYEHYKGGVYRVTDIVLSETNLEPMVVYSEEKVNGLRWTRTISEFEAVLDRDGMSMPRFALIESETLNLFDV